MKNINIARTLTAGISAISMGVAIFIQLAGQSKLTTNCSYLDPATIDIFAFAAALFLVAEGITKIELNRQDTWQQQVTRAIRVAFGLSIISLHIIHLLHK